MKRVVMLLAIVALLLTGCAQSGMSEAQSNFCGALATFQGALKGLGEMPADVKVADLQKLTDVADEAWANVMKAGENYKEAQIAQVDTAYKTLSQTLRSIPDDATLGVAASSVTQAVKSVQTAFNQYGAVVCPKK